MNKIEQTYIIAAPPAEVWRALTDPAVIQRWSDAKAEFVPQVGRNYSLWDGSIGGEIVAVVPHKKLAQTWKPDDWTIEDSVVTFTLTPIADGTQVDLLHENVEEFDFDGTTEGWDIYYLGAIKRMFEAKPRNTKITKATKAAKKVSAKGKTAAKKKVAVKKSVKKTAKKKK